MKTNSEHTAPATASEHPAGVHKLTELYHCPPALLDDEAHIKGALEEAVRLSGATLINCMVHRFSPQGVTALGLLAESHISIHTWPEAGYAAVDLFTCGTNCTPDLACEHLANALKAQHHETRTVQRGGQVFCLG